MSGMFFKTQCSCHRYCWICC